MEAARSPNGGRDCTADSLLSQDYKAELHVVQLTRRLAAGLTVPFTWQPA